MRNRVTASCLGIFSSTSRLDCRLKRGVSLVSKLTYQTNARLASGQAIWSKTLPIGRRQLAEQQAKALLRNRDSCIVTGTRRPRSSDSKIDGHVVQATVRNSSSLSSASDEGAKRLHAAFSLLERHSAQYCNITQLRLAVQGLKEVSCAKRPVTRIALLASQQDIWAARKLVQVLLADPLGPQAEWENILANDSVSFDDGKVQKDPSGVEFDGSTILLRYLDTTSPDTGNPLLPILNVPSSFLRDHRLEILISLAPPEPNADWKEYLRALPIPSIESARGAQQSGNSLTYPVHQCFVYSRDLSDVPPPLLNRQTRSSLSTLPLLIHAIADGPWRFRGAKAAEISDGAILVNSLLASEGLASFRESIQNSTNYQEAWFSSNLPSVLTTIKALTLEINSLASIEQPESHFVGTIPASLANLSHNILNQIQAAILAENRNQYRQAQTRLIPDTILNPFAEDLDSWVDAAHDELRDRMEAAWSSKSWKKLDWYKLFWRVDDIHPILSSLLFNAWLVDAERNLIWLNGKFFQAGLVQASKYHALLEDSRSGTKTKFDEISQIDIKAEKESRNRWFSMKKMPPLLVDDIVSQQLPPAFDEPLSARPLQALLYDPAIIPHRRQVLASTSIPSLQALGQGLLLEFFGATILACATSTLLYVAMLPGLSVLESGSVAALGTAWALRRLQRRWEEARAEWQEDVLQTGRETVRLAEREARDLVLSANDIALDELETLEHQYESINTTKIDEASPAQAQNISPTLEAIRAARQELQNVR